MQSDICSPGGYVSLNSSNPLDPPVINPNMFSSDFDTYVMREAIRSARRFMAAPAWADYVLSQRNPDINATSDADLDQFIRSGAASTAHPVGTASMSAKGASHGVVDPDLLVKGVLGLRIVDASVLVSPVSSRYFALTAHSSAAIPALCSSLLLLLLTHKPQSISLLRERQT